MTRFVAAAAFAFFAWFGLSASAFTFTFSRDILECDSAGNFLDSITLLASLGHVYVTGQDQLTRFKLGRLRSGVSIYTNNVNVISGACVTSTRRQ